MYRKIIGLLSAILIIVAIGYYLLLSKLNDFEDPLLNAAYAGDLQTVERLIASGRNVDFQDAYGNCPLTLSIWGKHPELTQYLLERGAKTEIKSSSPPLQLAIDLDQLGIFNDLLSHGADPDHCDKYLRTPLMSAVGSPNDTYLKALLDRKVNVEAQDDDGWRALHYCVLASSLSETEKILRLEQLIRAGADINARNVDAVRKMSQHDSYIGSKRDREEYGETALELAEKNDLREVAKFLRNHGAL